MQRSISSDLEYGRAPGRAKPSARNILSILQSKKNYRGVSKAFDSLVEEGARELDQYKRAVPAPANPYISLLKLPRIRQALTLFSDRRQLLQRKQAWYQWIMHMKASWDAEELYMECVIKVQKWAKHILVMQKINILNGIDTEEDATGSKPVDKVSAFAMRSVKIIRGQNAVIMQKCIRKWLAGFALKRQYHIKSEHVRLKSSIIIEKLWRGYYVRALFCVWEKRLLLQQLRTWAQGSTQKLLSREDLSDAEQQHLLLKAIYMSTASSRPLRSLPHLIDIKDLRQNLLNLQNSIENNHYNIKIEHQNRQRERINMRSQDIISAYNRNYEKLKAATIAKDIAELKEKRERIINEELKLKQRKNAMSVMAYYNLDQNNQRVERENMFREDELVRRYMRKLATMKTHKVNTDREMMQVEDSHALRLRTYEIESEKHRLELVESASAVRRAHQAQAGGVSSVLNNMESLFEGILPWWSKPCTDIDVRTDEEKRIDNLKLVMHECMQDIIFTHKPRKKAATTQNVSVEVPSVPLGHIPHKSILVGLTLVAYPTVSIERQQLRIKLGHLRCLRKERQKCYIQLLEMTAIFCKKHSELLGTRKLLKCNKFSTRKEKYDMQVFAHKQECGLPSARVEVIRWGRHYSTVCMKEMIVFTSLFLEDRVGAEHFKDTSTASGRGKLRSRWGVAASLAAKKADGISNSPTLIIEEDEEMEYGNNKGDREHNASPNKPSSPVSATSASIASSPAPSIGALGKARSRWGVAAALAVKEQGTDSPMPSVASSNSTPDSSSTSPTIPSLGTLGRSSTRSRLNVQTDISSSDNESPSRPSSSGSGSSPAPTLGSIGRSATNVSPSKDRSSPISVKTNSLQSTSGKTSPKKSTKPSTVKQENVCIAKQDSSSVNGNQPHSSRSTMPLADIVPESGPSYVNIYAKWARTAAAVAASGGCEGGIEEALNIDEIAKRRAYWGLSVQESCRIGVIRGSAHGVSSSSANGANRSNGDTSDDMPSAPFLCIPKAFPIETSNHNELSTSDTLPIGTLHSPSKSSILRNASLGSSLREQFGLDFIDDDNCSQSSTDNGNTNSRRSRSGTNAAAAKTSRSARRKEKALADAKAVKDAERAERPPAYIPGFTTYTFQVVEEYDFIQWVRSIQRWQGEIDVWYQLVEEKWKDIHRAELISALQRLDWMETAHIEDTMKESTNIRGKNDDNNSHHRGNYQPLSLKYDMINCNTDAHSSVYGKTNRHVASYASTIATQPAHVLYELWLSRIDWHLKLTDAINPEYAVAAENDISLGTFHLTLSSRECEKYFGLHPYSITAMFLLQNRLRGGTLEETRLQANIIREGVMNRWTREQHNEGKSLNDNPSKKSTKSTKTANILKNAARRATVRAAGSSSCADSGDSASEGKLVVGAGAILGNVIATTAANGDDALSSDVKASVSSDNITSSASNETNTIISNTPKKGRMTMLERTVSGGMFRPDGHDQTHHVNDGLQVPITPTTGLTITTTNTNSCDNRAEGTDNEVQSDSGSEIRPDSSDSRPGSSGATVRRVSGTSRPNSRSTRGNTPSDSRGVISASAIADGKASNSSPISSSVRGARNGNIAASSITTSGISGQAIKQRFNFDDSHANRRCRDELNEKEKAVSRAKLLFRKLIPSIDVTTYVDSPVELFQNIHGPESKGINGAYSAGIKRHLTEEKRQMKDILDIILDKGLLTLLGKPKNLPTYDELHAKAAAEEEEKIKIAQASPYLDSLGLAHNGGKAIVLGKNDAIKRAAALTGTNSEKVISSARNQGSLYSPATNSSKSSKNMTPTSSPVAPIRRANSTVGIRSRGGLAKLQRASSTVIQQRNTSEKKSKIASASVGTNQTEKHTNFNERNNTKETKKTTVPTINIGIFLHTYKCFPSLFVEPKITVDTFTVMVPRWLRPVCYWGEEAGEEPFWRRLQIEERSGTVGKYTLANRKDNRIDKIAVRLAYGLKVRLQCALSAKEAIIAPVRQSAEIDNMNYEDALSCGMRQDYRARRQRLAKINIKTLLKKKKKSIFTPIYKLWKIITEYGAAIKESMKPNPEKWIHKRLLKRPINLSKTIKKITYQAELAIDRGDDDAAYANPDYEQICINSYDATSHLSRLRSWITGAEVRIDTKTGKHKNLIEPNKNNINRAKVLMKQLAGVATSAEFDDIGANKSTETNDINSTLNKNIIKISTFEEKAINAIKKWPQIPESWCCGGISDGVVVVMRVIDQEAIVPRGGPIVELIASAGATHLRCGFHAKRSLCDDNKKMFATYLSKGRRIYQGFKNHQPNRTLCVDASKRLRQCEPIARELCMVDAYYATVLLAIYESRHNYYEAKNIISKIQGILRMRRARERVNFLRGALSRKLLHQAIANTDTDSDNDGDDDGALDVPATPMLKKKP